MVYIVIYIELTEAGKIIASRYFKYTEVFIVTGVIYLLVVSVITKALNTLEKKLEIPGIG